MSYEEDEIRYPARDIGVPVEYFALLRQYLLRVCGWWVKRALAIIGGFSI